MKPTITVLSLIALFHPGLAPAQTPFAEGLQYPQRLIPTPLGNFLVSEGGVAAPNNGRVSLVNRVGNRRTLIGGLPAARGQNIPAFGPTGMGLDGRTLYLLIGEGDVMVGPPFVINTDGPSSPIFSSILRIQFSADIDNIQTSFELTPNLHWSLFDGHDIDLQNATGDRATVHLLTAFRPLVRNILGAVAKVRPADPYGAWLDAPNNTLYVADASSESVIKVNTVTGRYFVMTRFQPDVRTPTTDPQYVDNVPTALCRVDESFLVSFLSAGPFPPGSSSVKLWSPSDGSWSRPTSVVSELTMTSDMLCLSGATKNAPKVVTVEYTTTPPANFTTPAGRVQYFDGTQKKVLAQDILLPTAVTRDPITGDLLVATLPGMIYRVPLP